MHRIRIFGQFIVCCIILSACGKRSAGMPEEEVRPKVEVVVMDDGDNQEISENGENRPEAEEGQRIDQGK